MSNPRLRILIRELKSDNGTLQFLPRPMLRSLKTHLNELWAEARVSRDLQPAALTVGEENDCPFPDLLAKRAQRIKNDRPSFAHKAANQQVNVRAAGEM